MKTTTATYNIRIENSDGTITEFQRTMPTKPTTNKGKQAQNDKLCKWVESNYSDYQRYEITPAYS